MCNFNARGLKGKGEREMNALNILVFCSKKCEVESYTYSYRTFISYFYFGCPLFVTFAQFLFLLFIQSLFSFELYVNLNLRQCFIN